MPYFYVEYTNDMYRQFLVEAESPQDALEIAIQKRMPTLDGGQGSGYAGWQRPSITVSPEVDETYNGEEYPTSWPKEKAEAWRRYSGVSS